MTNIGKLFFNYCVNIKQVSLLWITFLVITVKSNWKGNQIIDSPPLSFPHLYLIFYLSQAAVMTIWPHVSTSSIAIEYLTSKKYTFINILSLFFYDQREFDGVLRRFGCSCVITKSGAIVAERRRRSTFISVNEAFLLGDISILISNDYTNPKKISFCLKGYERIPSSKNEIIWISG